MIELGLLPQQRRLGLLQHQLQLLAQNELLARVSQGGNGLIMMANPDMATDTLDQAGETLFDGCPGSGVGFSRRFIGDGVVGCAAHGFHQWQRGYLFVQGQ